MSESDATISINGGPEVPLSLARAALEIVKNNPRGKKPVPGQTDIEDPNMLGRNTDNDVRVGGIAADRLRSIVERIERLEEERRALSSDVKDIYTEAKSAGFDVKVLRQLIRIRKQESAEVDEQETMLDIYRRALGM